MIVVVMGIAGSGKTTVGRLLAERLGLPFVEGDDHHPPENVAKMAAGIPLDDDDRMPWLTRLAAEIRRHADRGEGVVVSCSALRRQYRTILAGAAADVRFVHLRTDPDLIRRRMAERRDHYMPPTLVDSQIATLEEPSGEANVVTVDASGTPQSVVEAVLHGLGVTSPRG